MTQKGRRTRRWLIVVVAVLAGSALWVAEGASAWTRKDFYRDCTSGYTPVDMQQKCCEAAGGTWVVESYPDGLEIYKCVNIPEGDMPTYENEQPDGSGPTWTNNTEQAQTSGTYEQAEPSSAETTSPTMTESEDVDPSTDERVYAPREDTTDSEEPAPRNARQTWYE